MAADVGQPQGAVGHQAHAMRQAEALVPRAQVAPVAIEEDDRLDRRAAVEHDDRAVMRLDRGRDAPEPRAWRQPVGAEPRVRPVAEAATRMFGPGARRASARHDTLADVPLAADRSAASSIAVVLRPSSPETSRSLPSTIAPTRSSSSRA